MDKARRSGLRQGLLAGALIAVISFVSYAGSVHNSFVWDDNFQIARNPYLHADQPLVKLFTSDVWGYSHPGRSGTNYYRPLQMLSYRLLEGSQLDPERYHRASIFVNFLACWAAWAVLYFLCGRNQVALIAALLFSAHPIHSEAVMWISAFSDLGCALFYFLAFALYLKAWCAPELPPPPDPKPATPRKKGSRISPLKPPTSSRPRPSSPLGPRRAWLLGSLAAFFVSLFWKEMALSFPLMIGLHAAVISDGSSPKALLRNVRLRSSPFFAVAVIYALIRVSVLGYFVKVLESWNLTPAQYALSIIELIGKYWLKLLWPVPLNSYYVFEPGRALLEPRAVAALFFVAGAIALICLGARRWPVPAFAAAWVFVTLSPALNLSGVGENVFTERYLYIPSLGFCLLVTWVAAAILAMLPKPMTRVVAIAATCFFAIVSAAEVRARTPDWQSDYNLLSATLKLSPDSAVTHNGLGEILRDQKSDLPGAEREFRAAYDAAAASTPQNTQEMAHALVGLAGVCYSRGQNEQSLDYVNKALAVDPAFGGAYVAKGVALLALHRFDEAQQTFERVYTYDPNNEVVVDGLGLISLSRNQTDKALDYFNQVVQIDPNYPDAYENIGRTFSAQKRFDQALPAFRRALELAPENPIFHIFLGQSLGQSGQLRQARLEFERALAIDPSQDWARENLKVLDQMEAQQAGGSHP